jgi:paraquat-inducible protein A
MTLGGRRFLLICAVAAAGACLALGASLPLVRLAKPVFFAHGHSLISAVNALARSSQWLLAGVLLVFALLLPLLKLLYLVLLATLPPAELSRSSSQVRALEWLGRWSPHDAAAVGLTLALVASEASFAQHAGTGGYFFAAAIVLMMLAFLWLRSEVSAPHMRVVPAARSALTLATRGPGFSVLLGLAAGTFVLGLTLPALRLSQAYGGTDLHSLASLALAVHARGDTLLWLTLLALAFAIPGLRIVYLLALVLSRALPLGLRSRLLPAADALLGRYATADTTILAIMLFYLIASGAADPALQPGAYCFAASALLTLLAYGWANLLAPAAASESSLTARLAGLASADTANGS